MPCPSSHYPLLSSSHIPIPSYNALTDRFPPTARGEGRGMFSLCQSSMTRVASHPSTSPLSSPSHFSIHIFALLPCPPPPWPVLGLVRVLHICTASAVNALSMHGRYKANNWTTDVEMVAHSLLVRDRQHAVYSYLLGQLLHVACPPPAVSLSTLPNPCRDANDPFISVASFSTGQVGTAVAALVVVITVAAAYQSQQRGFISWSRTIRALLAAVTRDLNACAVDVVFNALAYIALV